MEIPILNWDCIKDCFYYLFTKNKFKIKVNINKNKKIGINIFNPRKELFTIREVSLTHENNCGRSLSIIFIPENVEIKSMNWFYFEIPQYPKIKCINSGKTQKEAFENIINPPKSPGINEPEDILRGIYNDNGNNSFVVIDGGEYTGNEVKKISFKKYYEILKIYFLKSASR